MSNHTEARDNRLFLKITIIIIHRINLTKNDRIAKVKKETTR